MKPLELGVATWSFKIPEKNFSEILRTIKEDVQLDLIQLGAFGSVDLTDEIQDRWFEAIERYKLEVAATCVAFLGEDYSSVKAAIDSVGFFNPDHFDTRFKHLCNMAELTERLDVHLLTTSIGYISPDAGDIKYAYMLDVTRRVADVLGEKQIELGLEVGGFETAQEMLDFIEQTGRSNVKISYDPGNLVRTVIDDPISSYDVLKDYVALIHVKDALPPVKKGVIGQIAALGNGEVGIVQLISKLLELGYQGALIIEGEGGFATMKDVCEARDHLREWI